MHKPCSEEYYKQLLELQTVDFVLVELTLYLDTHPTDLQAIRQFNEFAVKRKGIAEKFEHNFGPLMQFGHSLSRYPFDWIEAPWPWQV